MLIRLVATPEPALPVLADIPIPAVDLTPWGLLGIAFLMLMTGRIVVKMHYDSVIQDRDHWRDTAIMSMNTVSQNADTIKVLTEAAEFQNKVMTALQENAKSAPQDVV